MLIVAAVLLSAWAQEELPKAPEGFKVERLLDVPGEILEGMRRKGEGEREEGGGRRELRKGKGRASGQTRGPQAAEE